MEYKREYMDMRVNWGNMEKLKKYIVNYIKQCDYITAQSDKKINPDKICQYSDRELFEIYEDDGTNAYNMIISVTQDMFHAFIGIDRDMADMIREIQKGLWY